MDTQTGTPAPPANGNGGDSSFFGISVRAWLAILIVTTTCAISVMFAVADIKQGKELKIGEPLYTMAGMALGFYFGQKQPPK